MCQRAHALCMYSSLYMFAVAKIASYIDHGQGDWWIHGHGIDLEKNGHKLLLKSTLCKLSWPRMQNQHLVEGQHQGWSFLMRLNMVKMSFLLSVMVEKWTARRILCEDGYILIRYFLFGTEELFSVITCVLVKLGSILLFRLVNGFSSFSLFFWGGTQNR